VSIVIVYNDGGTGMSPCLDHPVWIGMEHMMMHFITLSISYCTASEHNTKHTTTCVRGFVRPYTQLPLSNSVPKWASRSKYIDL